MIRGALGEAEMARAYRWHLTGRWDKVMERAEVDNGKPKSISEAHRRHLGEADRVAKRRGVLPRNKKGV
jgi:hypothetical protein